MNTRYRYTLAASALAVLMASLGGCNKPPETTTSDSGVTPAPVAAPATGSSAGSNVADSDVTTNVKTALQQNDLVKAFDIGVVTLKGDVRLSGMVDSQAQVTEAVRVARSADGVHSIHDELTVKR